MRFNEDNQDSRFKRDSRNEADSRDEDPGGVCEGMAATPLGN
jgi:hypothetical protein